MKMLLDEGLLDGDCLTVTGKTLGRKPRGPARPHRRASTIVQPLDNPIKPTGHIQIL